MDTSGCSGVRALHVNDVASVASTLVGKARELHMPWVLHRIPPGRGHPARVASSRLVDLVRWQGVRRGSDLVHVHYAANGYYGWGLGVPTVLHVHGSDIRHDVHGRVLGPVIRRSLARADLVLYSTPNLEPVVTRLRPDALWLPNPLPEEFAGDEPLVEPVPNRVVFNMRWDEDKGGEGLVAAARELVARGVEVHGVSWGPLADKAASVGVHLRPLMGKRDFRDFLASAQVIVGQQVLGALGVSDLESLAVARPLVVRCDEPDVPVVDSTVQSAAGRCLELLSDGADAAALGGAGRDWVRDHRSASEIVHRLDQLYASMT